LVFYIRIGPLILRGDADFDCLVERE